MTTMGNEYQSSLKIMGATLFSVVLIVGAYTLARGVSDPVVAEASLETELLEQIATRDSDVDGLPDWEEVLYGTDPRNPDTRSLGMTDGEAVSRGLIVPTAPADIEITVQEGSQDYPLPVPPEGTITRALSHSLAAAYAEAVQASPTGKLSKADITTISNRLVDELNKSVILAPEYRKAKDLQTVGSTQQELRQFAISVEEVFLASTALVNKSEIEYLEIALKDGDQNAFVAIKEISILYQKAASGLAVLPVPQVLAETDLKLINALSLLSKVIADFARAENDPIASMLALKQYPEAARQMGTAFVDIRATYKSAGVIFREGEPGAGFVNVVDRLIADQKAEQL